MLDAHKKAMTPAQVLEFLESCTTRHLFSPSAADYWHSRPAVRVREDGLWEILQTEDAEKALRSARTTVRRLLERLRLREANSPNSPAFRARIQEWDRLREAHAAELSRLRRVVIHGFPANAPKALVLLDVQSRELSTFLGPELDRARRRLSDYQVIAALQVRVLLRVLDFDPGDRRLAELGPPQKSKRLNKRGRTLKITTDMLIRGSCGISTPLGDRSKLSEYLRSGQTTRLRRRLEADAKALFAYYQYGRLHHGVRLRWGFLDEMILAPWVHMDEPGLGTLMQRAYDTDRYVEVVVGSAPGWSDPWARSVRCQVAEYYRGRTLVLLDEEGFPVDDWDVQAARLA